MSHSLNHTPNPDQTPDHFSGQSECNVNFFNSFFNKLFKLYLNLICIEYLALTMQNRNPGENPQKLDIVLLVSE